MFARKYFKIYGIIEEIKKTHAMVIFHTEGKDAADTILREQFNIKKGKLLKELLAEVVLADISFKEMKHFILRLTKYLEKNDKATGTSKELKSNLAEIEAMLAI